MFLIVNAARGIFVFQLRIRSCSLEFTFSDTSRNTLGLKKTNLRRCSTPLFQFNIQAKTHAQSPTRRATSGLTRRCDVSSATKKKTALLYVRGRLSQEAGGARALTSHPRGCLPVREGFGLKHLYSRPGSWRREGSFQSSTGVFAGARGPSQS